MEISTPNSSKHLSITPGSRVLRSPLSDEQIWKRLREHKQFRKHNVFQLRGKQLTLLSFHKQFFLRGLRAIEEVNTLEPLRIQGLILRQAFFGGIERTMSELKLENDPILPLCVTDMLWELSLPIGADRDHEYSNLRAGNGIEKFDKMRELGWRVLVSGNDGDPAVDREKELVHLMEEKGVKVVSDFDEEGLHGDENFDPLKAKKLIELLKCFIFSLGG